MDIIQVEVVVLSLIVFVHLFNFATCQNAEERGVYFEGDMVGTVPIKQSRTSVTSTTRHWPNSTIVYEFESFYPLYLRRLFFQAAEHISARTCIKFKERKNEKGYVFVTNGNGCYSYVGFMGGKQELSLSYRCRILGTFIHEIIHAIGFVHEQSRTDRDNFVRINYDNIRQGSVGNFRKYPFSIISSLGVKYDYDSVMHYSERAFSKNGKPTIAVLKHGAGRIGQRRGMSEGDIQKINRMYCTRNQNRANTLPQLIE